MTLLRKRDIFLLIYTAVTKILWGLVLKLSYMKKFYTEYM